MLKFQPITRTDYATLISLVGATLVRVTYHYLPQPDGSQYAGGEQGVDCDLAAVTLGFPDGGKSTITWATLGEHEGLAIVHGSSYTGFATEAMDAALRDAWRDHIGTEIVSVGASWQTWGESYADSLWSLRLNFAAGAVVIALGTVEPGLDLDYMPNELIVIADKSLALSYCPSHINDSSWGSPIR